MPRPWPALSEAYVFLKGILREKELAFWIIVFPLLFLTLMVAIFGNPHTPTLDVLVVNNDEGPVAEALIEAMNETGLFRIEYAGSWGEAVETVRRGGADVALLLPGGFSDNVTRGLPGRIEVAYRGGEQGEYAWSIVSGFLDSFEDRIRDVAVERATEALPPFISDAIRGFMEYLSDPLRVEAESVEPPALQTPEGLRALYAFNVIGIQALFTGLFTGVQAVNEKRRTGALAIVLSSPLRRWEILAADVIAALAAVGVSSAVVITASLALGARYPAASPEALAVAAALIIVGSLFTIGLGLLLAPLARTPTGASALVNLVGFTVMFAGGLAIPVFVLPEWMRAFAEAWPLTAMIYNARAAVTGELPAVEALADSLPHILAATATLVAGSIVYRKLLEIAAERG